MAPFSSTIFLLDSRGLRLSHTAFKLAILTGLVSLLCFVVNTGYIVFDLYHQLYHSWFTLSMAALLSLTSFVINRQGYYLTAKILLGLTINLTIFYFASIEPIETGLSFLLVTCALGALTTLGLEHIKLGIIFVSLPVLLFLFSIVFDVDFFVRTAATPEYIRSNFIINFTSSFVSAVLMVYFLLSINRYSENALRANEKQLNEKNQELVKINKELDRFVYSASHDLRSPISSVRGLIGLIQLDPSAPEVKTYLNMMDNQLIGLNKFIEDIVVYSRNARLVVKKEAIVLKKLVDEVFISLQFLPESSAITMTVDVPDAITLHSDPTRVRVVLANLLSNAIKYSDLSKEKPSIQVRAIQDHTNVKIVVQDNGKGIAPDNLSRIFHMFFQVNEKAEGSGLGLYIVKETLEKIQGNITVQSEVGAGTVFTVTLPIHLNDPPDQPL